MARADSSNITHTSAPSRRGLLQGATAAAIGSSILTSEAFAGQSASSPEFDEWQSLALKTRNWFASDEYRRAEGKLSDELTGAFVYPLWDRMHELEARIFARPVSCIADAMVLGVIALYWNDAEEEGTQFLDGKVLGVHCGRCGKAKDDCSIDETSRGYLIRAVCMLAKATGQFPALADANFDLPPDS